MNVSINDSSLNDLPGPIAEILRQYREQSGETHFSFSYGDSLEVKGPDSVSLLRGESLVDLNYSHPFVLRLEAGDIAIWTNPTGLIPFAQVVSN